MRDRIEDAVDSLVEAGAKRRPPQLAWLRTSEENARNSINAFSETIDGMADAFYKLGQNYEDRFASARKKLVPADKMIKNLYKTVLQLRSALDAAENEVTTWLTTL